MSEIVGGSRLLILIVLTISITLAACGTRDAEEEGAVVAPTGESFLPRTPAASEESTPETAQVPDRGPSDSVGLVSLDQSLSSLSSYSLKSEMSFTGKAIDGDPLDYTITWESTKTEQPPASRLDINTEGFILSSDISAMSLARVGGETYLAVNGVGCVTGDDIGFQTASVSEINPDNFLSGLNGAKLVAENQIVNNIPSTIYQFDEKDLPVWQDSPVSVDGEIYIADDGGFVSGIDLTVTGAADFAGLGDVQEGVFQLIVGVSNVNEPLEIQPPLACVSSSDFPLPKDAFDAAYFEDLISFRSKMTLAEMVDYYGSEMPKLGWTLLDEDTVPENSAVFTYQKDGVTIAVFMTLAEDGKTVDVIISP